MAWNLTTEYQARMNVLADEINAGKLQGSYVIGIKLNPPLVEWFYFENGKEDTDRYDCIYFVESLTGMLYEDNQWDGESLSEYLETLTREFLADSEEVES